MWQQCLWCIGLSFVYLKLVERRKGYWYLYATSAVTSSRRQDQFLGKGATTLPPCLLTFRQSRPTTSNHNWSARERVLLYRPEHEDEVPASKIRGMPHLIYTRMGPLGGAFSVVLKLGSLGSKRGDLYLPPNFLFSKFELKFQKSSHFPSTTLLFLSKFLMMISSSFSPPPPTPGTYLTNLCNSVAAKRRRRWGLQLCTEACLPPGNFSPEWGYRKYLVDFGTEKNAAIGNRELKCRKKSRSRHVRSIRIEPVIVDVVLTNLIPVKKMRFCPISSPVPPPIPTD